MKSKSWMGWNPKKYKGEHQIIKANFPEEKIIKKHIPESEDCEQK